MKRSPEFRREAFEKNKFRNDFVGCNNRHLGDEIIFPMVEREIKGQIDQVELRKLFEEARCG